MEVAAHALHGLNRGRILGSQWHGMLPAHRLQPRDCEGDGQRQRHPGQDYEHRKPADGPRDEGKLWAVIGAHATSTATVRSRTSGEIVCASTTRFTTKCQALLLLLP